MGGFFSGRRAGTHSTDNCIRISLSDLRREGAVKRGWLINRNRYWWQGRDRVADLLVTIDIDGWAVKPCLRIRGTAFGRPIDQTVAIVAQDQPLGGERFYFLCPHTGRRSFVLLLPPGASLFATRQSWGIPYSVQRERSFSRALRGRDKAEAQYRALSKYTRHPTRKRLWQRVEARDNVIDAEEERLLRAIQRIDAARPI